MMLTANRNDSSVARISFGSTLVSDLHNPCERGFRHLLVHIGFSGPIGPVAAIGERIIAGLSELAHRHGPGDIEQLVGG